MPSLSPCYIISFLYAICKRGEYIGRILKNKVYLGTDYYPQIIDDVLFSAVQELRERNAKNQNRIHEYKTVEKAEIGFFHIGIVDKKYDDPYKQAEYAYGLIEENTNE